MAGEKSAKTCHTTEDQALATYLAHEQDFIDVSAWSLSLPTVPEDSRVALYLSNPGRAFCHHMKGV